MERLDIINPLNNFSVLLKNTQGQDKSRASFTEGGASFAINYNDPGTKDCLLQAMLQCNTLVFIYECAESAAESATQKERFQLASPKCFHKNQVWANVVQRMTAKKEKERRREKQVRT
jgi:hypothetical protein